MDETIRTAAISPLRQRLIDDMNMRRFSRATAQLHSRRGAVRNGVGPHTRQSIAPAGQCSNSRPPVS
jgi:hypothetical protein